MHNDEGLGEAMAHSYHKDRANALDLRVRSLEQRLDATQRIFLDRLNELTDKLSALSKAYEDLKQQLSTFNVRTAVRYGRDERKA